MKYAKRMSFAAVLILAAAMVFANGSQPAGGAGAAAPNANFNPTGYPIVKEKITLTGFGNQNVTHKNWSELYCFNEYEKKSNIHIEWTTAPNQGFVERKNVLLASGQYPDFFYRCNLSVSDLITYGSRGALLPLNSLIEQYGVNVKTLMAEVPGVEGALTMPDGNIYSLPSKSSVPAGDTFYNWINGRWLKNLGLAVPTTLDEFEAVLMAFKTRDANGNGNPNDEIPYTDRGFGSSLFNSTNGSFGMGSLGSGQFANYIDLDENGKVRLFAITDNFRQQLEWITGLYSRGLLDPEMFTQDFPAFTAKGEQDIVGAFFQNNNPEIIGAKTMPDYVPAPPLKGKSGKAVFNNTISGIGLGAFAVSSQTKYPAEVMRWIDYYYSYEGSLLMRLGQEGVTYVKNPDGSFSMTELITNNPQGLNMPQAIGQYAIAFAGGGCPEYARPEFERARLSPIAFEAYDLVSPFMTDVKLPILSFTTAEQDELNPIISDMITYIDETKVQFVTGRRPLSQWDAYVREVRNMGADRYVALQQAAYDRWSSN